MLLADILKTEEGLALYYSVSRSNMTLTARQRISFEDMFGNHVVRIQNLHDLMGNAAFSYLKQYADASVLQLNRFLHVYHAMPGEYVRILSRVARLCAASIKDVSKREMWRDLFIFTDCYIKLAAEDAGADIDTKIAAFKAHVDKHANDLQALVTSLRELVVKAYIKSFKVRPDQIDQDKLQLLTGSPYFPTLMSVRGGMIDENKYYLPILNRMLAADITGRSFDKLVHGARQRDKVGRRVGRHNKQVRMQLREHGVDVQAALHYQKQHAFSDEQVQIEKRDYQAVGLEVKAKLYTLLKSTEVVSIHKKIHGILSQLNKGANPDADLAKRIHSAGIRQLFALLLDDCRKNKAKMTEAGVALYENIEQLMSDKEIRRLSHYHVEQWDKSRCDTFFLGNYLSCCLATDGSYFEGMVQRRLDDAMMFHVVINDETKEPVSGAWLFFAVDENNKLVVVANFIEISSDYADYDERTNKTRDAIVRNLLYFTGEMYAKDVGADRFIMRKLSYGKIPDFKRFEIEKHTTKIKKVGDFCRLHASNKPGIENEYYLNALNDKSFHVYSLSGLNKQYYAHLIDECKRNQIDRSGLELVLKDLPKNNRLRLIKECIHLITNTDDLIAIARYLIPKSKLQLIKLCMGKIENESQLEAVLKIISLKNHADLEKQFRDNMQKRSALVLKCTGASSLQGLSLFSSAQEVLHEVEAKMERQAGMQPA